MIQHSIAIHSTKAHHTWSRRLCVCVCDLSSYNNMMMSTWCTQATRHPLQTCVSHSLVVSSGIKLLFMRALGGDMILTTGCSSGDGIHISNIQANRNPALIRHVSGVNVWIWCTLRAHTYRRWVTRARDRKVAARPHGSVRNICNINDCIIMFAYCSRIALLTGFICPWNYYEPHAKKKLTQKVIHMMYANVLRGSTSGKLSIKFTYSCALIYDWINYTRILGVCIIPQ